MKKFSMVLLYAGLQSICFACEDFQCVDQLLKNNTMEQLNSNIMELALNPGYPEKVSVYAIKHLPVQSIESASLCVSIMRISERNSVRLAAYAYLSHTESGILGKLTDDIIQGVKVENEKIVLSKYMFLLSQSKEGRKAIIQYISDEEGERKEMLEKMYNTTEKHRKWRENKEKEK